MYFISVHYILKCSRDLLDLANLCTKLCHVSGATIRQHLTAVSYNHQRLAGLATPKLEFPVCR